jgi:hypothetical protein
MHNRGISQRSDLQIPPPGRVTRRTDGYCSGQVEGFGAREGEAAVHVDENTIQDKPPTRFRSKGGGGDDDRCQIESSRATCNVSPKPWSCRRHQAMMWQLTPADPPCEQGLAAVGAGVGSDFPPSRICGEGGCSVHANKRKHIVSE